SDADHCEGLPVGLVHPDPAPVNLIEDADKQIHLIDWGGAGIGTRVVSLGQYLWEAAGSKGFDTKKLKMIADAYQEHVTLTDEELLRLPDAMKIRIFWLAGWNYFTRTLAGNPPTGDEWWIRRALHTDQSLPDALQEAFRPSLAV
ncbi:MAG: hypothetical protein AAF525_11470, partial [Pseudomonadota bacterium]